MKTQYTIPTKRKEKNGIHPFLIKFISGYINATSKALYPDKDIPQVKNDRNRIFYK